MLQFSGSEGQATLLLPGNSGLPADFDAVGLRKPQDFTGGEKRIRC
jgi:hypothetical protein